MLEADLALEALIVTATESIQGSDSDRRADEKVIARALRDTSRVEGAWNVVAHVMAARAAETGNEDGKWALGRLTLHRPLNAEDQDSVRTALDSFRLGYGEVDTNPAYLAFRRLVGDEATDRFALFAEERREELDSWIVDRAITIALDHSESSFLELSQWLRENE